MKDSELQAMEWWLYEIRKITQKVIKNEETREAQKPGTQNDLYKAKINLLQKVYKEQMAMMRMMEETAKERREHDRTR